MNGIGELLRALWRYRGFVLGSVSREMRARYLGSLLGAVWAVLNPMAMIVVYTVIFSRIMHARLPGVDSAFAYSIYLCAGLLPWNFFAETVNRSQSVFIDNGNLLKKSSFPRICLPTIIVISSIVNFLIIFFIFLAFLVVIGKFPGVVTLAVIPILLVQTMFAIGLGVFLGTINVFFRDVGQIIGIVLQFWFWMTPIVYPVSILPERIKAFLDFNPLTPLVTAYQRILLNQELPQWSTLMPVSIVAGVFLWLGYRVYRRNVAEMVDEL